MRKTAEPSNSLIHCKTPCPAHYLREGSDESNARQNEYIYIHPGGRTRHNLRGDGAPTTKYPKRRSDVGPDRNYKLAGFRSACPRHKFRRYHQGHHFPTSRPRLDSSYRRLTLGPPLQQSQCRSGRYRALGFPALAAQYAFSPGISPLS
jgi:hypothetical protein